MEVDVLFDIVVGRGWKASGNSREIKGVGGSLGDCPREDGDFFFFHSVF